MSREPHDDAWQALEQVRGSPVVQRAREDAARLRVRNRRARRLAVLATGAGGAAVVAIAFLLSVDTPRESSFATATGEMRRVALADGSTVALDTATRIRTVIGRRDRSVELVEGQAFFTVRHDAARPFRVRAGSSESTVLGTEFNVAKGADSVTIILVRGSLDVAGNTAGQQRLAPGQRVEVSAEGSLTAPAPAILDHDLAWLSARIDISHQTVRELLEEVNRYTRVKLSVQDEAVLATRVSGLFKAGDTETIVATLADRFGLKVERRGDSIALVR